MGDLIHHDQDALSLSMERVKRQRCPSCGHPFKVIHEAKDPYWNRRCEKTVSGFEKGMERLIDELDEMFPDTPIREYLDAKMEALRRGVQLLSKQYDEDEELTLEEECELENIIADVKERNRKHDD